MAKNSKKSKEECKAHDETDSEPRESEQRDLDRERRYTRAWAEGLLDDAEATADVAGACKRAGVSLADVRRLRGTDLNFAADWERVDLAIRLAAVEAVAAKGASGDIKAIRAMTDGTLDRLGLGLGPGSSNAEVWYCGAQSTCPSCGKTAMVEIVIHEHPVKQQRWVQVKHWPEFHMVLSGLPHQETETRPTDAPKPHEPE
jgi:hypothetical protein